MSGDRSWWRTARAPGGGTLGFGIPSRNHASPVVGYPGVLPEYRGRGCAREILAGTARILAAESGPTPVRADTGPTNVPMAAAFERLGYRCTARRPVPSAH
ncbi:GNAT family N-acetyltransferase [Kitasatospora sp. NPDC092039]|uniref:GNAT family N-acetyltransferase n=1 Tax=Kitasatospora sp. NPDC092039 TaxID=3364086 RepID=UPI003820E96B